MITEKVYLKSFCPFLKDGDPYLEVYIQDDSREVFAEGDKGLRPCILICPGGSYFMTSDRESEPVALEFLPEGYQVAVLRYSTADKSKAVWPQQIREVAAAFDFFPDTPETFIWHTTEDNLVPVENSLRYASSLAKQNIPFELHVYTFGRHGLATCDAQTAIKDDFAAADWKNSCKKWLKTVL